MILGQDFSHYNVSVLFPLAVSQGKNEFFYLKASEGARSGHPEAADDKYSSHRLGAIGTGKPFGPYHFLTMFQKAEDQVQWLRACAPDATPLPPILDAEQHIYEPPNSAIPLYRKQTHVHNWLLAAEQTFGRKPLIYTGGYWWKDNIGDVPWAKDYQYIIAAYLFYKMPIPTTFNPYWPGPRILPPGVPRENVIAWQYAGDIPNNGLYPWATGTQDFNVGDEKAIWALAGYKPPLTLEQKVGVLWEEHLARTSP